MHPSVASGRSLSTPPRNSAHPTASATVTSSLSWVTGTGALVDRGLREATGRRHRPEERARRTGDAVGRQLLVVVDRRLVRAAHGTGHRRVSRKHMMAMAKAPGSERRRCCRTTARPASAGRRDRCDQRDAVLVDRGQRHQQRCRARRRRAVPAPAGRPRPMPSSTTSVAAENTTVVQLMSARSSTTPPSSAKKLVGRRVAVDAEQLRQLAGGDREPDTDLDPGERRRGDVVDQCAEAQQPGRRAGSRRRAASASPGRRPGRQPRRRRRRRAASTR